MSAPLVLVTWNVHGWVGADRRRDPGRTLQVLRGLGADLAVLQEVDGADWEPFARDAGYRGIVGPRQPGAPRTFGNAIVSRRRPRSVCHVDLGLPGREPRSAVDVVVDTDSGPLRAIGTHFGLSLPERRAQARRLARHVAARDARLPLVLLGDFNDWTPWGLQLAPLARAVGPLSRVATFPSRRPLLALDRAAVRAPLRQLRIEARRSRVIRATSDHLPLRVEIEPARPETTRCDPQQGSGGRMLGSAFRSLLFAVRPCVIARYLGHVLVALAAALSSRPRASSA